MPVDAIKKYAALVVKNSAVGTSSLRKKLANALSDEIPIAISRVRNVWCCSDTIDNKLALINLVETNDEVSSGS
jgi:hypothetical protein